MKVSAGDGHWPRLQIEEKSSMNNSSEHQITGATILQFPVKARLSTSRAVQQLRFANEAALVSRAGDIMPTTGWYHDEAVAKDRLS